jgi:outer membrane protein insertion porin family
MKNFFLIIFLFFFSLSVFSADQPRVEDIKIEGLQRVDPGLVFDNIPFEINDIISEINFSESIKLLYRTGQFKNITIELEENDIIIAVSEKPIISEIIFHGAETFQPDRLLEGISSLNVAAGLVFDEPNLSKVVKELSNQYLSKGKYSANVKSVVTPLQRNRVQIDIYVDEGSNSRIKEIKIIGAVKYSQDDLLDQLVLKTTNPLSWWYKDDRYSKQILTGDLESIRSFYMDRGYLDFDIQNTTVSISESKKDVFIAIVIDEGNKYKFGDITVSGNFYPLNKEDILQEIKTVSGAIFKRSEISTSTEGINTKLGSFGYAFSNVNPIPTVDKKNLIVGFDYFVEPGQKVYVRRINFIGNETTKDKVMRREMRQLEASWYAKDKIDISKFRLTRTQYFDAVDIQTASVPGSSDQVDLNVKVTERNTGSVKVGAGVSSSEGVVGSFSVSQSNFLGTGNTVAVSMSTGSVNKVYSLSYTDPYFTPDGISRTLSIYSREVNTDKLSTGAYDSKAIGLGVGFGIPMNEIDTVNIGFNVDMTDISLKATSPTRYKNYCTSVSGGSTNGCDADEMVLSFGFTSDTRNNVINPTEGYKWSASSDISLPALDMQYYKFELSGSYFQPLSDKLTLLTRADIGYADEYGDDPYPFFKNYYVGGANSVRGYKQASVGKKFYDTNVKDWVSFGGTTKLVISSEVLFPVPGLKNNESIRLGAFFDGGGVWDQGEDIDIAEMRFSAGLSALWLSPFGPLNISLGIPLNSDTKDKEETFQFGMGTNF